MHNTIKIDVFQIPEIELRILCTTIAQDAIKFFENPENEAKFREWLKSMEGAVKKLAEVI